MLVSPCSTFFVVQVRRWKHQCSLLQNLKLIFLRLLCIYTSIHHISTFMHVFYNTFTLLLYTTCDVRASIWWQWKWMPCICVFERSNCSKYIRICWLCLFVMLCSPVVRMQYERVQSLSVHDILSTWPRWPIIIFYLYNNPNIADYRSIRSCALDDINIENCDWKRDRIKSGQEEWMA